LRQLWFADLVFGSACISIWFAQETVGPGLLWWDFYGTEDLLEELGVQFLDWVDHLCWQLVVYPESKVMAGGFR